MTWPGASPPFFGPGGAGEAHIELRQVTDTEFELVAPFSYRCPDGTLIEITPDAVGKTDLASIPAEVGWWVNRYGRHTGPAILHDLLVNTAPNRFDADDRFKEALLAVDVPPLRAHLMWAAVVLGSLWKRRRPLAVIWGTGAAVGSMALIIGLRRRRPRIVIGAILAPIAGSALWGRRWRAGIIAGYALWWVAIPASTSWAFFEVYRRIENARRSDSGAPTAPTYTAR